MHVKVRPHGHNYRTLVGQRPYGTYPDWVNPTVGNPPLSRRGFEQAIINQGGAQNIVARVGVVPPIFAQTGALVIADNDFSTGSAWIELGAFNLIAGLDFEIGVAAANTATNLAASISRLPGYSATANLDAVMLEYTTGPMDQVSFRAHCEGTIVNFTPVVPATGYLSVGTPAVSPPAIF